MNNLLGKSEIYMVISPCGKRYIGQTKCFYNLKNKKVKKGLEERWKSHVYYAKKNIQGRGARYLMNSIQKYGEADFKVKTIFICDENKADYYETKYIRQYNTLIPNGMNIMAGGKSCKLSEETKKKISVANKGKYEGSKNPNYGKKTSEETKQKIREKLVGKKLAESVKQNMRNAIRKMPPRRVYDLPEYIYHVINKQYEGYEIRHHPVLRNRKFVSMQLTMEEKLELAKIYLS